MISAPFPHFRLDRRKLQHPEYVSGDADYRRLALWPHLQIVD
jgi:hypothetical protein